MAIIQILGGDAHGQCSHHEYLVQRATAVVVDILAVPGLVVWRVFHGKTGEVEHLTEQSVGEGITEFD